MSKNLTSKPEIFCSKCVFKHKTSRKYPTRLYKLNRFYPANKTFGKNTTNSMFCQVIFNKFTDDNNFKGYVNEVFPGLAIKTKDFLKKIDCL